ncbi:MAG: MFS transporter [Chloroflexi bacterium]|nr:MFS transporter [Chloroflexota bacterium]
MAVTNQRVEPLARSGDPASDEFDAGTVVTISAAHFLHDTYPAFLSPLLPLLIDKFGLSLAAAGALVTIQRSSSMLQPFIGFWADRTDARFMVILPPTLSALALSFLGLAPNYLSLVVLIVIGGISTAMFHPAAGAMITRASGKTWGRGTSLFMTGGELGRSLGPIFIVAVVSAVGLTHSYIAVAPGLLASLAVHWRLGRTAPAVLKVARGSVLWATIQQQKRPLLLLTGSTIFRVLGTVSFTVFYPTYLVGTGWSLLAAGAALSIFELAGAAGALFGGTISDRFGRRQIIVVSQLLAVPLLYLAVMTPGGAVGVVFLVLAGFFALSVAPVQLALIQELLPENRSVATGILIFLGFEGAVFATVVFGAVADQVGLLPTLIGSFVASLLAIPFTLLLPETRRHLPRG